MVRCGGVKCSYLEYFVVCTCNGAVARRIPGSALAKTQGLVTGTGVSGELGTRGQRARGLMD